MSFRAEVEKTVSLVPAGYVTTYGDVAARCGHPAASRVVGGIAHTGSEAVPWHRLVNRFGGLALAYPGGRRTQRLHLESEGVTCTDDVVDEFSQRRWRYEE